MAGNTIKIILFWSQSQFIAGAFLAVKDSKILKKNIDLQELNKCFPKTLGYHYKLSSKLF